MRHSVVALIAAALVFGAPLAAQQISPTSPRIMFGPFAGMNYTTVYGSDISGADSRTAFAAGGQLDFTLSANGLFRTGLIYSGRGFEATDQGITGTLKISYLEIPLLLGYRFPTSGGMRPYLLGGAQIGFKVGCDIEGSDAGQSISFPCDDPDFGADFSSTDVAAVGGAGLALPLGVNNLTIELRYALGLQKIAKDSNLKNKGFTLGVGLMVPVGK